MMKLTRFNEGDRIGTSMDMAWKEYAFANKFLSVKDLEKVREELRMTELGKSLINEGKDEGKKEKTIEIVKKAIEKGMDNETIKELMDLDIDKIELIRKVLK